SWDTFCEAWGTLPVYLSFDVPDLSHFSPYDPLQMHGYTFVIFILAPFMMLTGIAMSPAVRSRFPCFVKTFGDHQGSPSLHFLVHTEHNVVNMVFGGGEVTAARGAQGVVIMVSTIVAVIVFWIALSFWSLADRARAQRFTERFTEIGRAIFLNRLRPVGSRKK